jgi:2-desacetyl-2-hydroxyethyl bacteriochlorophyllide A dehydrogenase
MAGEPDSAVDLRPRPDVPEVMRAAVLFGPRDMRVVDRRVPRPGPDEVLVRVPMCGTCGTDLKIFDGGFAEYAVHHVSALYPLPPQLSFEDGVLMTTAGTGLYGLDVAGGYIAGLDVVVFGPGPVGLTTVQVCKALGAGRVILVGTRQPPLELGRRLGADHVINAREADPVRAVLGLTGGAGADMAIECSGGMDAPQQCAEITKRGGKIVVVAFYPGQVTFDLSAVVRKDISIHTSRGEGGNNVKRAVALAAQGKLRGAEMVTHRFPLEDITTAFRVVRDRDGDPVKVVIVP